MSQSLFCKQMTGVTTGASTAFSTANYYVASRQSLYKENSLQQPYNRVNNLSSYVYHNKSTLKIPITRYI